MSLYLTDKVVTIEQQQQKQEDSTETNQHESRRNKKKLSCLDLSKNEKSTKQTTLLNYVNQNRGKKQQRTISRLQ